MELKKIQSSWNGFPELSMEERPVLSSDLEKMVVANPFPADFYLQGRLLARILLSTILWIITVWRWRVELREGGNELGLQLVLSLLLVYSIYFHVRLLLFADYGSLLALPLNSFLNRIETIMDKYMFSFMIVSAISGFFLLAAFEKALFLLNSNAYASIHENGFYKWLIIVFLSISVYILLLNTLILKYKKKLAAIRAFKSRIREGQQKL